jgi:hypothetical protein
VHEKSVLEAAARAVEVAEVVDRRAVCVDSRGQHLADRVAEPRVLRRLQRARRA